MDNEPSDSDMSDSDQPRYVMRLGRRHERISLDIPAFVAPDPADPDDELQNEDRLMHPLPIEFDDVEHSDEPETSTSEEESQRSQQAFDVALPVRHSYLGEDLEELSGCTLYDENSTIILPLLIQQQGTMALPGQTLPLSLFHTPTIGMLRETVAKDRTFGLVSLTERNKTPHYHDPTKHRLVGSVGVTAEVYEHRGTNDVNKGYGLKARCRQRFRVLDVVVGPEKTLKGRVIILPEISLPSLLPQCRNSAHTKISNVLKRKSHSAALTAWPAWVYKQYDEASVIERMKGDLEDMRITAPHIAMPTPFEDAASASGSNSLAMLKVPSEPAALSFWVAQNLPLVDDQRNNLLEINSSLQRLRWEHSFLEKCKCLCCQVCGEQLALLSDTFSMSVEGPQGTYVNPSGYLHETMTVTRVTNLSIIGQPSAEYSWFPGYKWTIANCRSCNAHIGWRFTSSSLLPRIFWGLSRRSIITLMRVELAPEEDSRPTM